MASNAFWDSQSPLAPWRASSRYWASRFPRSLILFQSHSWLQLSIWIAYICQLNSLFIQQRALSRRAASNSPASY